MQKQRETSNLPLKTLSVSCQRRGPKGSIREWSETSQHCKSNLTYTKLAQQMITSSWKTLHTIGRTHSGSKQCNGTYEVSICSRRWCLPIKIGLFEFMQIEENVRRERVILVQHISVKNCSRIFSYLARRILHETIALQVVHPSI